jgi:hemoglobin
MKKDDAAAMAAGGKSLFMRLGGEDAIKAVVADFVGRAAANPQVNFTRKGTAREWQATSENVAHLQKMLVDMIGAASGGPQKYMGKNMKEAHAGMKITAAEFDALAADLKASLDKFKVPAPEQDELLKVVGSTKGDIVEQ